ncbi:MAG: methionyl-tRNA formyltransferase [Pontimonas sp.]|nr:methionyl-tRNA formyltransferase [Pontimonas sp.]
MRVVFAGSPEVALPTLRALSAARHTVVGVLTQPPRPVGRKQVSTPTPVALLADELGLSVATPETPDDVLLAVRDWSPDIAVVVAYGRLLGPTELSSVPHGWWNVHFSLLPKWRGAAPVPYAIAAGDDTTGVSVFRIEEGLDTGPVAHQRSCTIAPHDTAATVLSRLADLAPELVLSLLEDVDSGSLTLSAQDGDPSFAPKPSKEVGELRWSDSAENLYNQMRAWREEPGCFGIRDDTDQRVKIIHGWSDIALGGLLPGAIAAHPEGVAVGTGTTALVLAAVQPAGKSVMDARDWFRGLPPGVRFRA